MPDDANVALIDEQLKCVIQDGRVTAEAEGRHYLLRPSCFCLCEHP